MARAADNGISKETTIEDLGAQIETLRTDLASLTATMSDLGKVKSAQLKEAVRHKGVETADYVETQLKDARARADLFVSERPSTALGIAAGLGFLVGYLARKS